MKKLNKTKLIVYIFTLVLIIAIIALGTVFVVKNSNKNNKAIGGILDLSNWDKSKTISLSGEWNFYWGKLLNAEDLKGSPKPDIKADVPSFWNNYKINGENLPGFGYATYHLHVKGVRAGETLAMSLAIPTSAYEVYIDEEFVSAAGKVGTTRSSHQPELQSGAFEFTPQKDYFNIVMQISNYTAARGGLAYNIYFGTPVRIAAMNTLNIYLDLLMIGSFFIMLLVFASIYLLRRADRRNLYFALLCMFAVFRTLFYGEFSIASSFALTSYENASAIVYITLYWIPAIFALLVEELFPSETSKNTVIAIIIYTMTLSAIVILTPMSFYTKFSSLYEISVIIISLYLIIRAGTAFLRGSKDALFILAGIVAMLLCGMYDMLSKRISVSSGNLDVLPIGFFVLVLLQAFVLIKHYVVSIKKIELLNAELIEADKLKDRIMQTEMAFLQSQIKPHFLYNALSAISNVCAKDAQKAERLIIDLAFFLRSSFDWSSEDKMTMLESELQFVNNYIHIEQARFGDKIKLVEQIDTGKGFQIPKLILQPIVENAVRHGISKKKGGGEIYIIASEIDEGIYIEVCDNGVGMNSDKVSSLLSENNDSKSVGLRNIHSRLMRLYGSGLNIKSKENIGTSVSFIIREEKAC